MAEKISTLIIKVDLDCCQCYKKIRKTLCKLQDRENIRTISYDEKNNTVTVSGPFDPKKLTKKLYCKASCKVIKDIQIVEPPKEKEKPKEVPKEKPKEVTFIEPIKEKPKPAEPAKPVKEKEKEKEKPKDAKPAEPAKPAQEKVIEKTKVVVVEPVKEKPKAAAEPAKPVQKHQAGMVQLPGPACPQMPGPSYQECWPAGPVCNCGPWYEAHYGGTRCCACGRTYGWVSEGPPYDGNRTCHFFSDEDPASTCNIM